MTLILVATADGELRAALRDALQREGYTVTGVDDGRRALNALVSSSRPAIALLDDGLPIFDALQLLRYLRLLPADSPRHPVVLLAGGYDVVRALVEAGYDPVAVRVLLKPFTLDALLAAVGHAASRLDEEAERAEGATPPERRVDTGPFDDPPRYATGR
jgi:CheY-like chemotaxis protein